MKLFSAAKTLLRHPELSAAQSNHEYVFKEVYEAIDKIHGISTNRISSENIKHLYDEAASLSAALDELDVIYHYFYILVAIICDPLFNKGFLKKFFCRFLLK